MQKANGSWSTGICPGHKVNTNAERLMEKCNTGPFCRKLRLWVHLRISSLGKQVQGDGLVSTAGRDAHRGGATGIFTVQLCLAALDKGTG